MSLYANSRWSTLRARRSATQSLHTKAEVWRPSSTPDGRGGVTQTLTHIKTLPARIDPPTESERLYAEKLDRVATAVVSLPFDTVLQPGDDLIVGSRILHFVGDDSGGANAYLLRAIVSEFV